MRCALFIALAFAVTAATKHSEFRSKFGDSETEIDRTSFRETIFRPGYEYIYRYESHVLSGIPAVSSQVGGVKINAVIKMQFIRGEEVTLKMERVTIFTVNDVIRSSNDVDVLPDVELVRLTGEQEQAMVEQLVKPIQFRYEEGEVRDLKTTRSDKYWSINIKKGLASLFQLKLTGRSTPWSDSETFPESPSRSSPTWNSAPRSGSRSKSQHHEAAFSSVGSRRSSTSRLDNAFQVMEMDVNGECETKYVIKTDTSGQRSSVSEMVVSKVKNFENCLARSTFDQGLFAHLPHYASEKSLIQPSFEAEYILTGDRHHFLIKKATVEAKYFFKPYGPEGGQMSTHITQKLRLESAREIRSPLTLESVVVEKNGLKMEIPRSSWTPEGSTYSEEYEEHHWKELIDERLNALIGALYPVMQETSSSELFKLQQIVRSAPRRELVAVIKEYLQYDRVEFNKKGEILLDILPTSINPETGSALLDLIRDGTVRGIRARVSITAMSLTVKPTPGIVMGLMSLYHDSSSLERSTPLIRQTILLSVGTLCNKMINHMRRSLKPIPELTHVVEEISQELTSLLSEANTEIANIRVLKAMGNMGAKELISPIKTIIEDRSLPVTVRVEAIFALRKLAKHFDKMIHPMLMTMILNPNEHVRVRIAGVMVLKNSIPTYTTLQLLSHSLRSEQSTQFKSFVYTTFISLANLKNRIPELRQTATDARKILKTMRSIPVGVLDSKDILYSLYSERLDMGAAWNLETIKSERTGLPQSIFATFYKTIFGNRLNILKGGVEGEMVTSILRRLVGPYGLFKDILKNKASVFDLFKPLSRPEMTVDWRDFLNQKKFSPITEEQVDAVIFGQTLGYDVFYRTLDSDSMEYWAKTAMRNAPKLINSLREGISINTLKTFSVLCNSIVLPTPMGIPLSLNMSANAIFKLDGYVKATSMPSFVDFISRRPFMTKKFEIDVDIKPSWNMRLIGYMGADLKWLRTGMGIKADIVGSVPIKRQLVIDPIESKLTMRFESPTESVKIFHVKVEPVTFKMLIPLTKERLPYALVVRTLKVSPTVRMVKYDNAHENSFTDFHCTYKAQWPICAAAWCPYFPLSGKSEFQFNYKTLSSSPKELVLSIKKFTQDWHNEDLSGEYGSSSNGAARSFGNEAEYDRDFDAVTTDNIITSPRKVELYIELAMNGYTNSKVFKGKMTWLTENNNLDHQLNAQFIGVGNAEMNPFKFKFNSVWRCPVSIYSNFESENERESESYLPVVNANDDLGKFEFYWGTSSFTENTIKGKVWKLDEVAWKQELIASGVSDSYDVSELRHSPEMHTYGAEVTVPSMSYRARNYLNKVHDLIKFFMYQHMTVGNPQSVSHNKIVVVAQYLPDVDKMNVIFKCPMETDVIYNIPFTGAWSKLYRPHLHDSSPSFLYRNDSRQFDIERFGEPTYDVNYRYKDNTPSLKGFCTIRKDKMISFDGAPILLPFHQKETGGSKCDVLLARDCSDRSTFAVTGSFRHGHWAIKVIVPSYKIELVPKSSHEIEAKVNERDVTVSYSHPAKFYEVPEDTSSQSTVTIKKIGKSFRVQLHESGVTISVGEDNKIKIKVSPASILQGRLCGLCGNNNYDLGDDMTTFDGKLTNSRSFVMDNVMPSEHCSADDYSTQLGLRHQGHCESKKTLMTKKMHSGESTTCFSKNTMTSCGSHCSTESMKSHKVSFVCLPTEDASTERLIEKYLSGNTDLTEELKRFNTTHEDELDVADKCVSSY